MFVTKLYVLVLSALIIDNRVDSMKTQEFFPDAAQNLTKINWAHAVNNQSYLSSTLKDAKIDMIEADIVLGTITGQSDTTPIPIMAHPPTNTSDLSLESFLTQVRDFNTSESSKKGVKLDFKTIDVFEASKDYVAKFTEIFRHGNRTPNSFQELYPNDPYLNETYYPYGLGQLTNAGKLREFSIGTSLRRRYKYFLNDLFLPEEVEAVSTDYNRTKASLELALAGLFPPKGELVWNKALMWQPVPYNYVPRNRDKVLMGVECPTYLRMYEEVKGSWEMQIEYKKFRKVFSYISRNSGLNVTSFQKIYNLYFGLSTEQENGLFLPPWTRKVWPRLIIDMAIREYSVMMANDDLRKMASGYLLKKILSDTAKKISDRENKRKIHIYSAHENNVAQLLILLDVFWPHIPNYGAHVILEVHRINGEVGIKVFYQNYETDFPQLLKIPECEEFCPLDQFIRLFSKYVPEDGLCGY